jgi:hypothetical protein
MWIVASQEKDLILSLLRKEIKKGSHDSLPRIIPAIRNALEGIPRTLMRANEGNTYKWNPSPPFIFLLHECDERR